MRKQTATNEEFAALWEAAPALLSRDAVEARLDATADRLLSAVSGFPRHRVAYGWSGGKDSIVLAELCRRVGLGRCWMSTCALEWPAFAAWCDAHAPAGLERVDVGLDLPWLARNPHHLFPWDAPGRVPWVRLVQRAGEAEAVRRMGLDAVVLGRRREDGNVARDFEAGGYRRACPLADWTHLEVMAAIRHLGLAMPPIYGWPDGWLVGTSLWPMRQRQGTLRETWAEVASIDRSVVEDAARLIPSARSYLARAARDEAGRTDSGTG